MCLFFNTCNRSLYYDNRKQKTAVSGLYTLGTQQINSLSAFNFDSNLIQKKELKEK